MDDAVVGRAAGEHRRERDGSFVEELVQIDGRLIDVLAAAHEIVNGIVPRIQEGAIAVELFWGGDICSIGVFSLGTAP